MKNEGKRQHKFVIRVQNDVQDDVMHDKNDLKRHSLKINMYRPFIKLHRTFDWF